MSSPDTAQRSNVERPLSLFYSYAREDRALLGELDDHLSSLKRAGLIRTWFDEAIQGGQKWEDEIRSRIDRADIVLLLVTPAFVRSDYANRIEVSRAMARHEEGSARVIPVYLREANYSTAPYSSIQGVPPPHRPAEMWSQPWKAYLAVADEVEATALKSHAQRRGSDSAPYQSGPWSIPSPDPSFSGRDSLVDDVRRLLALQGRVVLSGLGGVGKTQTALEVARRRRDHYDIGWVVRASDPGVLQVDLNELALQLGLAERTSSPEATMSALQRWWSTNSRWVLVYDNAEGASSVRGVLPSRETRGDVIVTSRATAWREVAEPLEIGVLDPEGAVDLLLRRSGLGHESADAARELAYELGHLPLALSHAAGYCEASGCTFAEYLDLYRLRRKSLLAFAPEASAYPESVATTWSLSLEQTSTESPTAGALMNLSSCLAPDALPVEHILGWGGVWPLPLEEARRDRLQWDAGVRAARRRSLMQSGPGGLGVHRLVQAVTFDGMDQATRALWVEASQTFALDAMTGSMASIAGRLEEVGRVVPHALAASGHGGDPVRRVQILDRVATYFQVRAAYAEAVRLFRRALVVGEAELGRTHVEVVKVKNDLGLALRDFGRLDEAEALFAEAIQLGEATLPPGHPDMADRYNNLGLVYHDRAYVSGEVEDLDKAEEAYRRALEISEASLPPDHTDIPIRLNNLGLILRDRGAFEKAEATLKRAVALDEAALGPQHMNVAVRLNNLGTVLLRAGDAAGAVAELQRAFDIIRGVHGDRHPDTAKIRSSLAEAQHEAGDPAARGVLREILDLLTETLGPDHFDTMATRKRLETIEASDSD